MADDDFSKLTELDHYWGWLPEDPATAVRGAVEGLLASQVPGAVVEWMKVTGTPQCVTGGRKDPRDEQYLILVRAAAAVPFELSVRSPDGARDVLWGVVTWAAAGLDTEDGRRDRLWLDLDTEIAAVEELLSSRVYEVEAS